jgi:hypothetical protein
MMACKHFGDLKKILPEEGEEQYIRKSVGFSIVQKLGGYWDFIRGSVNRDELPLHLRKLLE